MSVYHEFCERRLRQLRQSESMSANLDRIKSGLPVLADAVSKMRQAGLEDEEIESLFRHTADQLQEGRC